MKKKNYKVFFFFVQDSDVNSIVGYTFKKYNYVTNYKNLFIAFIRFKQLKRFAKELLKTNLYVRSYDVLIVKFENDSYFGKVLKEKTIFRKGDK